MYKSATDYFLPCPIAYIVPLQQLLDEKSSDEDGNFSYLVPRRKSLDIQAHLDEKCVIIPMPGVESFDVDYEHPHIGLDHRMRRSGGCFDCLMLARDSVALSSYIVHKAGSESFGRLCVVWLFEDRRELAVYRLEDELIKELWLALDESECIARTTWLDGSEVLDYLEMLPSHSVPPRC